MEEKKIVLWKAVNEDIVVLQAAIDVNNTSEDTPIHISDAVRAAILDQCKEHEATLKPGASYTIHLLTTIVSNTE